MSVTKVELSLLHQLQRWYRHTKGGQRTHSLGWRERQAEIAESLLLRGYLEWRHPEWRRNGFYVLTAKGRKALADNFLDEELRA